VRTEQSNGEVEGECAEEAQNEEEEVLQQQWVRAQWRQRGEGRLLNVRNRSAGFLDARPCEVDVKEEQQDT
jgi:hypothetical protein